MRHAWLALGGNGQARAGCCRTTVPPVPGLVHCQSNLRGVADWGRTASSRADLHVVAAFGRSWIFIATTAAITASAHSHNGKTQDHNQTQHAHAALSTPRRDDS